MNKFSKMNLGILGGGQLASMLMSQMSRFGVKPWILAQNESDPAIFFSKNYTVGDLKDYETVVKFGEKLDAITIEIEHVNVDALKALSNLGVRVFPSPEVLEFIQNKLWQKKFLKEQGFLTPDYFFLDDSKKIKDINLDDFQFPLIQKTCFNGYDGKGIKLIRSRDDSPLEGPSIFEKRVSIIKELSVIVVRSKDGLILNYPVTEMIFNEENNLLNFLLSPARIDKELALQTENTAREIAERIKLVGILAVEFFLDNKGNILVNEMAPRPHNSGHHTIEANITSQFEQYLRIILDLPMGSIEARDKALMFNLLGTQNSNGMACFQGINDLLKEKEVYLHYYGKKETRPFRKMGHVTLLGSNLDDLISKAKRLQSLVKVIES